MCYSQLKVRTSHAIAVLLPVSCPGWYAGGFKPACTKDMWEQEKDAWKKRRVSYDPKEKAILDPIFAEAAVATADPNRNPSQNFNGSDHFEAFVRDVRLHTTFIVPAFLVRS